MSYLNKLIFYLIHLMYVHIQSRFSFHTYCLLIHHVLPQCLLNNSSHSSLLVNTADPCSRVSVLLGHHSHAGKLCQSFLASEIFSLVSGSRSKVDIKIHKGVLYIRRHVRSRERRWDDKHSRSTCTDNKPQVKARPVSSQLTHLGLLAAFMSTQTRWPALQKI